MDYTLAKQLKDAGFPQNYRVNQKDLEGFTEEGKKSYLEQLDPHIPTLSELITACGESFHALKAYHRPEVEWIAMVTESFYIPGQITGKTPEEAVARLWIALNTDVVIYCNEQEHKGTGFMFACCKGCKHNP